MCVDSEALHKEYVLSAYKYRVLFIIISWEIRVEGGGCT